MAKSSEHTHVVVEQLSDHVTLRIDDCELFDFIDDFLTEQHDLEYSYMETEIVNGKGFYVMHFPICIDADVMKKAIGLISHEEIQSIWELNN